MKAIAAPFRFLIYVIGSWTSARIAMQFSDAAWRGVLPTVSAMVAVPLLAPIVVTPIALPPAPTSGVTIPLEAPEAAPGAARVTIILDEPAAPVVGGGDQVAMLADDRPAAVILVEPPPLPRGTVAPPATEARASRWSGSAWLFGRGKAGSGLATGGQLGGSQAGARLAYRIADPGPGTLALAARVSTPLRDTAGAEAALGVDWHPVTKIPLRLSIERRVAIGKDGRNAWSAYAAGGLYRSFPGHIELDAYAQAGVVGAKRRDGFVDGAVRVGRSAALGETKLLVGGGGWGAAQPGVTRLDIGPYATIRLPIAGATISAAIDWRIRIAGDATPGSGAALTLAADF